MSEQPATMREAIQKAVDEHLASIGGGFRLAMVYAVDVVDSEGESVLYLSSPEDQPTYRSVGLTEYLRKWFDIEARECIAASAPCDCDDEDH